jgi:hypothetical protein
MLYFILKRHSETIKSHPEDEQNHYQTLKKFVENVNLSDLISALQGMSDMFPKWGNKQVPDKTTYADIYGD